MQPVSSPPAIDEQLPAMGTKYKWIGREKQTEVSEAEYENSGLDRDRTFTTIYPPVPSAQYAGKPYGYQTSFTSQKILHATFFRHSKWKYTKTEVWLECVPKE